MKTKEWMEKADLILSGKKKLSLVDMSAFVKTGENVSMFQYSDSLQTLKEHIKKARSWVMKLDRLEQNATSISALEELLPEAEGFMVDIQPNLDAVMQVTKVYCFCRQPFHGIVVGCDAEGCEDWLHISCIGMSKAQVLL